MKRNLLWFFGLAIMAATTFTMTSCDEDPCKDVECGANGDCFDGACVCNQGFEGTNCDVTWANKFVGTWTAKDVCTDANNVITTYDYSANVTQVSETKINIKNFGGFGVAASVDFDLSDASTITISGTDNQARVFTGTGTYGADGKITYSYTVKFTDNTVDSCTGTMSK